MKVSKKARRGRKGRPKPHKQHRKGGATFDPITRAKRVKRRQAKNEPPDDDLTLIQEQLRGPQ